MAQLPNTIVITDLHLTVAGSEEMAKKETYSLPIWVDIVSDRPSDTIITRET